MKSGKFFLTIIILLVVINDFKAEKSTTLDEPLQKLTLISHLLNSIAIRNGLQSGHPNIHTGISEMLKIPRTNSLLKFLDLDIASTKEIFKEFRNSMDNIEAPEKDGSDGMLKLSMTLNWVKRYQKRLTAEKIDKAKEEIDKYKETLDEAEDNVMMYFNKSCFDVIWPWLRIIDFHELTQGRDEFIERLEYCSDHIKIEMDRILEHRKKFQTFSDLKNAVKTFRVLLELSKDLSEIQDDLKNYSSFLYASISSLSSWISGLNPQMSMGLHNFIQTLSQLIPAPEQNKLSISFVETRAIQNELSNDWFKKTIVKNQSLEDLILELTPIFEVFNKISLMYPYWEREIIKDFGALAQNYAKQADQAFEAVKYGIRLSDIQEVDVQCLQGFGKLSNFNESAYTKRMKDLQFLEKQLGAMGQSVQKILIVPERVFEMTIAKLEPVKGIVQDTTRNYTEKWDLIEEWKVKSREDVISIRESLDSIKYSSSGNRPSIDRSVEIVFASDEFKNLLKSTNISEVVKCIDESSLPKLNKLVHFLKNVHAIRGAQPKLSTTLDLMEEAKGFQEKIRSVIEDAKGSGKSKFQGIQNIQKTAEDVSQGVQSLRSIQILLQNFESITNLTQNPDFNNDDRIKLVNLWRELQKYNETLASFPSDSNFSDLWSTVFGEAAKIRDIDFSFEDQIDLPTAKNRDKILLASKAFKEVEEILERVMGPEEEKKVNTVKEGFTSKYTPIPYKPPFAYNLFKIYYLEMVFVVTIVAFPLGLWLHERSKEIVLNSN